MPNEPPTAREVYEGRRSLHHAAAARGRRAELRFSWVRLLLGAATATLLWPVVFAETLAAWWLLVPIGAFVAVVPWHARVARERARAERAVAWNERGLARLDDRWSGTGRSGARFLDPHHPYAADLDLFGAGSVFELLCRARTPCGEAALAGWLLEPASPETIGRRQEAVEELRGGVGLREDLAVLGEEMGEGIDPAALAAWATAGPVLAGRAVPVAAALLAAGNVGTFLGWLAAGTGPLPWALSLVLSSALALAARPRVRRVLGSLEHPQRELGLLGLVLGRIERERFRAPLLVELGSALDAGGARPSRDIARLARIVETAESRQNMIFAPLAALLLGGTQLAYAAERWRAARGSAVPRWLESVGEVEALSSLAGHAFEHPADPFPEIAAGPRPCFEGQDLGHPLLPARRSVPNDVRLDAELRLLVVSGSNMSGKSTLLRTVGVNAVLAQAGAPVRAARLRISPLAIGAALRVVDSLQDGTSHFYAEILRLRQLVDLGRGPRPLLFLLDELFGGTNSHDRRVGAEAVIRRLVEDGGIGLVTTHDLALAEVARVLEPRAANVHFEDHVADGTIVFDYRLRTGVVTHSNALALMRAVGLEVGVDGPGASRSGEHGAAGLESGSGPTGVPAGPGCSPTRSKEDPE